MTNQSNDRTRFLAIATLVSGVLLGLVSALGGLWFVVGAQRLAADPSNPPNAGNAGLVLGLSILGCGVPLALVMIVSGVVIEVMRRIGSRKART